jgi:hypothetical protein
VRSPAWRISALDAPVSGQAEERTVARKHLTDVSAPPGIRSVWTTRNNMPLGPSGFETLAAP